VNAAIRDLITDLKAAVRIGHSDSIQAALDGFRALPEVASNQPLSDDFLSKALLPLAVVLANPRLSIDIIKPLAQDSSAALRALAAAAYSLRYLQGGGITRDELTRFASDPRSEVPAAIVQAILSQVEKNPDKLNVLIKEWLNTDTPIFQQVGLQLVAGLHPEHCAEVIPLLSHLSAISDPDRNAAHVAALNSLAQKGFSVDILSMLKEWLQANSDSDWIITKTLSSSWAAGEAQAALEILHQLALQKCPHKQIVSALRALIRHGAGEAVQSELARWRKGDDEKLHAIAEKIVE
jgi:hypothetical protein